MDERQRKADVETLSESDLFDEFDGGITASDLNTLPPDEMEAPQEAGDSEAHGGHKSCGCDACTKDDEIADLPFLKRIATAAGTAVTGDPFVEEEFDPESGWDGDLEAYSDTGLTAEAEALAHYLAGEAAETEDDEEADCLAGGLVVQIFTTAPVVIKKVLPALMNRTVRLVRMLRRKPRIRPLVRVLPVIEASTMATLSRAARQGLPVTRRAAIRTLGRETVRVFRNPRRVAMALRRNSARRRWFSRRAIARSER